LYIPQPDLAEVKVFPNPSKDFWQIKNLPAGAKMTLTDMGGHVIWTGSDSKIPGRNLPAGHYLLRVYANNDNRTINLIHW